MKRAKGMTQESIEENLNLIYASASDVHLWRDCLEQIAGCINATSGMLGIDNIETGLHLSRINYGYEPEMVQRLISGDLKGKDLWTKALIEMKPKGFMFDAELVETNKFLKSLLFQDLLRSFDIKHTLGAYADKFDGVGVRIAFQRKSFHGHYSEAERRYMDTLLPHIKRSIQLSKTLNQNRVLSQISKAELENHRDPIILVSSNSKVIYANELAYALALKGDLLDIKAGYLSVTGVKPNDYASAIESVCRDEKLIDLSQPYEFVQLGDDGRPKVISISRYQLTYLQFDLSQRSSQNVFALVRVCGANVEREGLDNDQTLKLGKQRLSQLFGLTKQEVDISLMLSEGLSPQDIADANHRSLNTIRTQIKSISAKLKTNNVNQLITQVSRIIK